MAPGARLFVPWWLVTMLPDTLDRVPQPRSWWAYMLWLARRQWRTQTLGAVYGTVWTGVQALLPWAVGRTIDDGVVAGDPGALLAWCAVVAAIGLVQAVSGVLRHRMAVWNWMGAALRSLQLVGHHVSGAGPALTATRPTGEVVATAASDAPHLGELYDVAGRFVGACVSCVLVAVLVLRTDVALGLVVLIGVPLMTASLAVLVRPLQARRQAQRTAEGKLTELGADTVAGLRVLRGIGGEREFVSRYAARSRQVRAAGIRVAAVQAILDAAHVLLPGAFAVVLTWLGARAALVGRITPGELVTLYGYAAFLVIPLSFATEALGKAVRAKVAATRIVGVLRVRPADGPDAGDAAVPRPRWRSDLVDPADPADLADLADPVSGLLVPAGSLTALVSDLPDDSAAVAGRLARLEADLPAGDAGPPVASPLLGGVPVGELPLDVLRRRVLLSEAEPRLFTGTLREQVDPGREHGDAAVLAALDLADAGDVLDALPGGLSGRIDERGRSLSGGQRQRVALARAVLADPEVLLLVDPTSAVDAHTEARIAGRLAEYRTGRTTLVTTASPLLLDRVDRVAYLRDGVVVAAGAHHDLLREVPGYRAAVIRGEDR